MNMFLLLKIIKKFFHLRELIKSTSSLVPTTTWFAFSKLCEKIKKKI